MNCIGKLFLQTGEQTLLMSEYWWLKMGVNAMLDSYQASVMEQNFLHHSFSIKQGQFYVLF